MLTPGLHKPHSNAPNQGSLKLDLVQKEYLDLINAKPTVAKRTAKRKEKRFSDEEEESSSIYMKKNK